MNVVHLRDPVCPLPTSILAQYLKQSSGQLSCLKVIPVVYASSSLSFAVASIFTARVIQVIKLGVNIVVQLRNDINTADFLIPGASDLIAIFATIKSTAISPTWQCCGYSTGGYICTFAGSIETHGIATIVVRLMHFSSSYHCTTAPICGLNAMLFWLLLLSGFYGRPWSMGLYYLCSS